jgi:hypothetical protein
MELCAPSTLVLVGVRTVIFTRAIGPALTN